MLRLTGIPRAEERVYLSPHEVLVYFLNSGIFQWNILMFPFKLEEDGHGLYWVIHILILEFVIRLILILEISVGQLHQSRLLNVWGKISPVFKGIGTVATLISIYVGMSTSYFTSMSMYYATQSITQPLCWINRSLEDGYLGKDFTDTDAFYRNVAFPSSSELTETIGLPHWHLLRLMIIVWIVACIAQTSRSWIASSTNIMFSTAPYLLLLLLLIGSTANGASVEFGNFKVTSFDAFFNPMFWIGVIGHCFIYLPLGLGTATSLGSDCKLKTNTNRLAVYVCILGFFTERIVGVFYFTVFKHLSDKFGVSSSSLQRNGPVLIFVKLLKYFSSLDHNSEMLTMVFCVFLVNISLNVTFAFCRGLHQTIQELLPKASKRKSLAICGTLGVLSATPFLTNQGKLFLFLTSSYGVQVMRVIVVLLEVIAITLCGFRKFRIEVQYIYRSHFSFISRLFWKILPLILIVVFVKTILHTKFRLFNHQELPLQALGIGIMITSITGIGFFAPGFYEIWKILKYNKLTIVQILRRAKINKSSLGSKAVMDKRFQKPLRITAVHRENYESARRIDWV